MADDARSERSAGAGEKHTLFFKGLSESVEEHDLKEFVE
jgi:hypothetical protein